MPVRILQVRTMGDNSCNCLKSISWKSFYSVLKSHIAPHKEIYKNKQNTRRTESSVRDKVKDFRTGPAVAGGSAKCMQSPGKAPGRTWKS